MKRSMLYAAAAAATLLAFSAHAAEPVGTSVTTNGTWQVAGLAWRCGKNNPAMWGTFGNGCLKQKRKAKKASSSQAGGAKLTK